MFKQSKQNILSTHLTINFMCIANILYTKLFLLAKTPKTGEMTKPQILFKNQHFLSYFTPQINKNN